jgi:hypothetical protein
VLDIVLTDGFAGDEVVVRVGGEEVFRGVVRTDQRVGVARAIDPVPREEPVLVEVEVPGRGLAASVEAGSEHSRVEVALLDDELHVMPSAGQTHGYA